MNTFPEIKDAFAAGHFIIVHDEHREEEGDFFVLAEAITPEKVNFMLNHARGMICIACDHTIINQFQLPPMAVENTNAHGTNFYMSIDAKEGITTGVSAADRAHTIGLLADKDATAADIVTPGHSFPLLAKNVAERFGHTEAAVELAKTVGKIPAVAICENLNEHGEKANMAELRIIRETHDIPVTTLANLQLELV